MMRAHATSELRIDDHLDGALPAARTGAAWALRVLYEQLSPAVVGYLRVQGAAEPEDLASETFLGVFRNLDRFEGDGEAFRSWVFTIAHRRLIDERRRRARRPAHLPLVDPDTSLEASHEDEVASQLDLERLRPVLDRLPPAQRDALVLRVVADLSHTEVAEALGKRPGAIRVLQHRALKRLREELADEV